MTRQAIAAAFASARKAAGYKTRYALAKASGVPISTIDRIEDGECSPTVDMLERVWQAIGWEVSITFGPGKRKRRKKKP